MYDRAHSLISLQMANHQRYFDCLTLFLFTFPPRTKQNSKKATKTLQSLQTLCTAHTGQWKYYISAYVQSAILCAPLILDQGSKKAEKNTKIKWNDVISMPKCNTIGGWSRTECRLDFRKPLRITWTGHTEKMIMFYLAKCLCNNFNRK